MHIQKLFTKDDLHKPEDKYTWFSYKDTHPFEHDATDFSLTNALWLAESSRLAYLKDIERIRKEYEYAGFTNFKFFDKKGTQCLVASSDKAMIVAFRGTEPSELKDVKADIKFFREKSLTKGKVHRGFKDALSYVWKDLESYIKTERGDKTVWLTGHSLGAALATIAASRIKSNGLYTYGSPRVGNKAFAKFVKYRQPTFRFVNNNDIVTRVPLPPLFRHTNKMAYMSTDGKLYRNSMWWRMLVDGVKGNVVSTALSWTGLRAVGMAFNIFNGIRDHNIINYCIFLSNLVKK